MSEITHCPNCKINLQGEDIYQHFLDKYNEVGADSSRTIEETLRVIAQYPGLYKDAPSEIELRAMSDNALAAWNAASSYGWTKANPRRFGSVIGIEVRGLYDGVAMWKCPSCNYVWKRFDWVSDEIVAEYSS